MKRIIIHWTAGAHTPNAVDLDAYHFVVDGKGKVHPGKRKPEANLSTGDGDYSAHTRRLNTGSIGVAFAAMHGARERPFSAGRYPITPAQVDSMARLCADLCETYGIEVTPQTVRTHAEVEETLGGKQRNKWDVMWLPGYKTVQPAKVIGGILRRRIIKAQEVTETRPAGADRPTKSSGLAALFAALAAIFRGKP